VSAVGDIGEDDLFALMNPLERSAYWVDMHHYSNAGYELIASQVVEKVTAAASLGARSTLAGGRPYASIEAARDAARTMPKASRCARHT
jgi:CubicO group peptidase (beta-lactamase class C family)